MLWQSLLPLLPALAAAAPPNILILLTDDQGFGDTEYNCENSTGLCALTPNIHALATSPHTALFHRFYSASPVCSPTRAAMLTGRTNQRSCIWRALTCCHEDPAPNCSMSVQGALPHSEFTLAKAAKKSKLGDYATLHVGKWHLGDLWNKEQFSQFPTRPGWPASSPGDHGFDEWMTTQAEASNSMTNCGCFPVTHANPGKKPPAGYADITPNGDQCVVGGGFKSDWCYPCTNYYYPNATDATKVTGLREKVPGDDSTFIVDRFETFLKDQVKAKRPWLAHLCFHAIHEPHPAMPEFYSMYANDPDYLGALTMWDKQVGRLLRILEEQGVKEDTVIFYTADNGPHQGTERSDIRYSTNNLRQCKGSMFEGGIRVPGLLHYPRRIKENVNITAPVVTMDVLPTVVKLLEVESSNPTWMMDGIDLLPLVQEKRRTRGSPIGFWTIDSFAVIDEGMKLVVDPLQGQCPFQAPYDRWRNLSEAFLLYDLERDYNELHDLSLQRPEELSRMRGLLEDFKGSVERSMETETRCGRFSPEPFSDACEWRNDTALNGADLGSSKARSKEECCGRCQLHLTCRAAAFVEGSCHLKEAVSLKVQQGSVACLPRREERQLLV